MKKLNEYLTPETDAALLSPEGHELAFIESDFARNLERKLALCRDVIEGCAAMLCLDDEDSYAADDCEGAIDTAHGKLKEALEATK